LLAGVATTETDSAGLFKFPLLPPGRYVVQVGDTAFAEYAAPRKDERQVVVTKGDTVEANFFVTARDAVVEALCPGKWSGREMSILLGRVSDGSGSWPADLRVEGEWFAALTQTSAGVSVTNGGEKVGIDDRGRFVMCGIAKGGVGVRLRLRTAGRIVADTALSGLSRTARVHTINWTVRRGLFDAKRDTLPPESRKER
jgi:hypothetical protein